MSHGAATDGLQISGQGPRLPVLRKPLFRDRSRGFLRSAALCLAPAAGQNEERISDRAFAGGVRWGAYDLAALDHGG